MKKVFLNKSFLLKSSSSPHLIWLYSSSKLQAFHTILVEIFSYIIFKLIIIEFVISTRKKKLLNNTCPYYLLSLIFYLYLMLPVNTA